MRRLKTLFGRPAETTSRSDEPGPMYDKPDHFLLLAWLILTGLIGFALFCSWHQGVIWHLFSVDRSRISWIIALAYLLISVHCLYRVCVISRQHQLSQRAARTITAALNDQQHLRVQGNALLLNDTSIPQCIVTDYLRETCTGRNNTVNDGPWVDNGDLGEVYEVRLKGPQEIGWFAADMMLKLGLLGTIVGFIFMLGSVSNISDFDVATMQKVLKHMSNGMGTALYTTLAGLVCSLFASLQYHMIDQHCDELLTMCRHIAVQCNSMSKTRPTETGATAHATDSL